MLKAVLLIIGGVALLCGIAALETGAFPPGVVFAFWGGVLVLCLVCERVIYKPIQAARPDSRFQRTTERFVDEDTGKVVTVFIDPATGERAYVRD